MKRNFRTMRKAEAFRLAQLDQKIQKFIDADLTDFDQVDLDDVGQMIDETIDGYDFGYLLDGFKEDVMSEVEDMGYATEDDIQAYVDENCLDRYAIRDEIEDYVDRLDFVEGDMLGEYVSRAIDRYFDDVDLSDEVDAVVNTYDFDLVLENTHLVQRIKDLETKVAMLDVLVGLENVKK